MKKHLVVLTIIIICFLFSWIETGPIPGSPIIRLNQAGFLPEDDYKTAVVSGLSGSFEVKDNNTHEIVFFGTLKSLGTDNITSETLYVADFSSVTREGIYYITVGNNKSYKFEIKKDVYNKVLYYATRVYGANRCGPYDSWAHQHCHTNDGIIRGQSKAGSLVGGWHDCGDYVKFGHTGFYAACALLFAYNAWPEKFGDYYGMNYDGSYHNPKPDGIPDILNEVKVYTDYLLNLYNASVEDGLIQQNRLYYQVGDGDDDHNYWHKPEYQDDFPQSQGGQPREVWSDIGADLAGRFAAALAMMATAYWKFDVEYANQCLNAAKNVYNIAKNLYGVSGRNTGGKSYYSSDPRADDDLALAALQIYKATGDPFYLQETQYWMAKEQKWEFRSYYVLSFPNVFAFVLYDYYPYASVVDNLPGEFDTKIVTKSECLEWLEKDVTDIHPDIYGRRWGYTWGTCKYIMGVAATACMAYDLSLKMGQPKPYLLKIAKEQINWVFGRNQFGMSFVIGSQSDDWLTYYPQHPHHAAVNPEGVNVQGLPPYQPIELTGATIGGPTGHTEFVDRWDNYYATESGVDYWVGLVITSAYLAKPVSEIVDSPPFVTFSTPTHNSVVSGEVDVVVVAYDDKEILKVELWIGGEKVREVNNVGVIEYRWETLSYSDGRYILKAVAYDNVGQVSEKQIEVIVNNGGVYIDNPPEIEFNLLSGSTVSGSVDILVSVIDDSGVVKVELWIGGDKVREVNNVGVIEYRWETLSYSDGRYILKAVAYDNVGQVSEKQIEVYVNNEIGTYQKLKESRLFLSTDPNCNQINFDLYFDNIKEIKIFTSSGKLVKKINSKPFKITNDLFNKSGVYLCSILEASGRIYYCTVIYAK